MYHDGRAMNPVTGLLNTPILLPLSSLSSIEVGTFKNFQNLTAQLTSRHDNMDVVDLDNICIPFILHKSLDFITVSPRGWRVLVESPDRMATLTKSNIFTEDSQVQVWADELKRLLVEKVGSRFGGMTTCFFSDCCGYEYTHKQVRPTPFPRVLFDMLAKLMPACGIHSKDMWPNGVNVNYYPDG